MFLKKSLIQSFVFISLFGFCTLALAQEDDHDDKIHKGFDEEGYNEQFIEGQIKLKKYRPKTAFMETKTLIDSIDKLNHEILHLEERLRKKSSIKLSSFIQLYLQRSAAFSNNDNVAGSVNVGDQNRISIPRARFKMDFENILGRLVASINANEQKISLRDLYFYSKIKPSHHLKAGIYKLPFGLQIPISSSVKEIPERVYVLRQLFNSGFRDLGLSYILRPQSNNFFQDITLQAGYFNGNAAYDLNFSSSKLVAAKFSYFAKFNRPLPFDFGMGASFLTGGFNSTGNIVFERILKDDLDGKQYEVGGSSSSVLPRLYIGLDATLIANFGLGRTKITSEMILGRQTGTRDTTFSVSENYPSTEALYIRDFEGGYVELVQNTGRSNFQIILRYDWYDQNRNIWPIDLKQPTSRLTAGDLKRETFSIGTRKPYNKNLVYFMSYDFVISESAANIQDNNAPENTITIAFQYTF